MTTVDNTKAIEEEKKNVIIVDNSEENRMALTEILGDTYDYVYSDDGDEILEMLANDIPVDIILLDVNVSNLGGMEVLKVMQMRSWIEEIPVVVISSQTDAGIIQNTYSLGAIDYIARPFNPFLVKRRVENVLTLYSQKKKLVKVVENQVLQRESMNSTMINVLSKVLEMGNRESGKHTLHVRTITNLLLCQLVKITDKYNLSEADIALISSIATLHDIGKITIPDEILNKPGKLTPEEWEIMKSHTVSGDELLSEISTSQNKEFARIAHEICRFHHERYDGGGYPDGLCGDDIPISAQVVSLADVYDALTSDRCYKKAIPHEKAVAMILDGECGVFNPLLIKCFSEISDKLLVDLELNIDEGYDFLQNSRHLTGEVLKNENLKLDTRSPFLAEYERIKKDFFASRCRGIQFEFDAFTRRISYITYYDDDGERVHLKSDITKLLSDEDLAKLNEKVLATTKQKPFVNMTVLVPINGDLRWHDLLVRTIWASTIDTYIGVVGQLTDIHDKMVLKGADLIIKEKVITGSSLVAMRNIFDIVRVVNPETCETLKVAEDGTIRAIGQKCYETWNRGERCKNCTSKKAFESKQWMSKLETKNGKLYSVLSKYAKCKGLDCILEVAFCIDESFNKVRPDVGFSADSLTLENYYRDSLTKTFSRAYLDNFMPNIENAMGIAIADIDKFKTINDTYGHAAGDEALKKVSKVIKSCLGDEDVLIRYGGDEFLLVFNEISKKDFFAQLDKIKEKVSESELSEHPEIDLGISIGGAFSIHPFEKAVEKANKEMYKDKFNITD